MKNGSTKEFSLSNLGQNAAFQSFLQEADLLRINTLEASLEEVFIAITGKALQG